jgi:GTP-binding protein EngB required for normal cell division
MEIIGVLKEEGLPFMVVCTKCDTMDMKPKHSSSSIPTKADLNAKKIEQVLVKDLGLKETTPLFFSSTNGLGKSELWTAIKAGILGISNSHVVESE